MYISTSSTEQDSYKPIKKIIVRTCHACSYDPNQRVVITVDFSQVKTIRNLMNCVDEQLYAHFCKLHEEKKTFARDYIQNSPLPCDYRMNTIIRKEEFAFLYDANKNSIISSVKELVTGTEYLAQAQHKPT